MGKIQKQFYISVTKKDTGYSLPMPFFKII
jgi:hypothetical protein